MSLSLGHIPQKTLSLPRLGLGEKERKNNGGVCVCVCVCVYTLTETDRGDKGSWALIHVWALVSGQAWI